MLIETIHAAVTFVADEVTGVFEICNDECLCTCIILHNVLIAFLIAVLTADREMH